MTSGSATRRIEPHRQEVLAEMRQEEAKRVRNTRLRSVLTTVVVVASLAALVTALLLTSRTSGPSTATRKAPGFTLADTSGKQVSLSTFRGRNVVLYFSEGAGCAPCTEQVVAIEKERPAFTAANVTVLPIVMNTKEQITTDMATYGAKTPFLLDDGTVSKAYDELGKGMHAGLPGHGFVLIDKNGVQRWTDEYPQMWLSPTDLLTKVKKVLSS